MAVSGVGAAALLRPRRQKALIAVAVFVATIGGWAGYLFHSAMHEPLPGGGGRQGRCVIWLVGSSSIANWTSLERDLHPWVVHNRGVGGAKLSQIVRRFGNDRGVPPPEAIVFYAGENDIAANISVEQAFGTFRSFMAVKNKRLGAVPTFFISLKPTPRRWKMRALQASYNDRVRGFAAARTDLSYIDIVPEMLIDGRPGPFFDAGGIHLLPIGYARWGRRVTEALARTLPDAAARCGTTV